MLTGAIIEIHTEHPTNQEKKGAHKDFVDHPV